jgi:hypothetical protein
VRPSALPATGAAYYPQYIVDGAKGGVRAVRPVGEVDFKVAERVLPKLISFEIR